MMNCMETYERLKQARINRGLTQGQVVEYLSLSKSYVSQLESGTNQPNVWPLLARLAQYYKVSTDYLLGLTDNPTPSPVSTETLTEEERVTLEKYRRLSPDDRTYVDGLVQKLLRSNTPRIIGEEE